MMHKNACSEKVVLFFLKKTYTIINKCITFVASRDVVLQELHEETGFLFISHLFSPH